MSPQARARQAAVALLALAAPVARAQHDHHAHRTTAAQTSPEIEVFVARARAATERFQHHAAAVAAGYRLMGPDMPNMGEHWINPGLAVRRAFDVERPAVLTYLRVDGRPVLTGVAYLAPVRAGEAPPPVPLPGAAWHFHSRSLMAEAFGHGHHAPEPERADRVRLAMIHAWIWTPNPDGVLAADNWALPFVRAGLAVPERAAPDAARAVFLTQGGVDYYVLAAREVGEAGPEAQAALRAVLDAHRRRVEGAVAAGALYVPTLEAAWRAAWAEVERAVEPALWARIAPLAE